MNNLVDRETKKKALMAFFEKEVELRGKFRLLREQIEKLIPEISKHNREFVDFWNANYDMDELLVSDEKNIRHLLIKRPERKDASIETYLPFSVDFKEYNSI